MVEEASCKCGYKLIKPTWESLINTIYREGGNVGSNICPQCKEESLNYYCHDNLID